MSMTHYMELLMQNSPYNLIFFMAVPVILAETAAITELLLLTADKPSQTVKKLNKSACLASGLVFIVIDIYLLIAVVIPLTDQSLWRGIIDITALFGFLIGGLMMIGLALVSYHGFFKTMTENRRKKLTVLFLSAFLVLSHLAMIAGMADPQLDPFYQNTVENTSIVSKSSNTVSQHMHH